MGYKWDVFLSYPHASPSGEWVHETFFPLFSFYLRNALNRPATSIFIDREGIDPGDSWPYTLQLALAYSRCLVAIWLPDYFHSTWCTRELMVMLYREKQLGYRTRMNSKGLVLPVKVFDGDHFPRFAQRIEHFNCTRFFKVGKGFKNSELYLDFQDELASWTYKVAEAIKIVPEWKSEWLNDSDHHDLFPEELTDGFELPLLS